MPADLRRKLRATYPVFGLSDLVVRWLVPFGLLFAIMLSSWPVAVAALAVLLVAWFVRVRAFSRIVAAEGGAPFASGPAPTPGPPQMRPYYETWPLVHKEYGHPSVAEDAKV